MATLNIKNMSDSLYKKLQARAKRERRSVAQEVTHLLSEALEVTNAEALAFVVAVVELGKVALQVGRADVVIRTHNSALQN